MRDLHILRVVTRIPNDVETDLVRTYEFSGNQLKLSGTNGFKPSFKLRTVTLERATRAR